MKTVNGTANSASPRASEDEASCLCQGEVPEAKKLYLQQEVFDEKQKKRRWKSILRYHIDCPIHGVRIT